MVFLWKPTLMKAKRLCETTDFSSYSFILIQFIRDHVLKDLSLNSQYYWCLKRGDDAVACQDNDMPLTKIESLSKLQWTSWSEYGDDGIRCEGWFLYKNYVKKRRGAKLRTLVNFIKGLTFKSPSTKLQHWIQWFVFTNVPIGWMSALG